MLLALGAKVTAASRPVKLARAAVFGAERLELDNLHAAVDFDVIFNTIPAMVLPWSYLRLLKSNTVIIDIAAVQAVPTLLPLKSWASRPFMPYLYPVEWHRRRPVRF